MRSILVVFMVSQLLMPEPDAKAVFHLFVAACYLLPLFGAYISDRFLGKYKTIMTLSMFYCAGHAVLSVWENKTGMYVGLALIALGAGGIKPCVSAHVGDQFTQANKHLVKKVFDLFYWMINFGSFFSTIIIPWTYTKYGAQVAFGIPGILMFIATYVFWLGRKYYVHVPPTGKNASGFVAVTWTALLNMGKSKGDFFSGAAKKHKADAIDAARAVVKVAKLFITVSVFWALFDQHASSWILQGQRMNLDFMGMNINPVQLQALNPIMVMVLIPLFSFGLYPAIEKYLKIKMTPLKKMSTGMYIAALSFLFVAIIQSFLDRGQQINIMWQFVPYLVLTCAEVMISITGLEFAYTQAPRSVKSTIMSFWLLTVFIGNLITAYISKINIFQGSAFFLFFAALMLVVAFIFTYSAMKYKVQEYIEG
ncbi:MAG: MFS transporter [Oligoflexia bacterium]|nr:MFS transporter [Oligoflexia bacterium]